MMSQTLRISAFLGLIAAIFVCTAHAALASSFGTTTTGGYSSVQQRRDDIELIEPIDPAVTSIAVEPGAGTFITYFEVASQWLFEIAVGFAVIWVLIGGFTLMIGGENMKTQAKDMMKWAILGLLLLIFAGYFLRTLNDIFFV